MEIILGGYQVNEPTWLYLSCLLILAVFFRFSRPVSVRNIDLCLLLTITPGLLLVSAGQPVGFAWLFLVSALLLARVLSDGLLARRPQLKPNMNSAGMLFLCAAAFVFLMTKVVAQPPDPQTVESMQKARQILRQSPPASVPVAKPALSADRDRSASGTSGAPSSGTPAVTWTVEFVAAKTLVVLAHLAVIVGLILVGRNLFGDTESGVAMATLYMLLPCTARDASHATQVLPAALIVWSLHSYRRPFVAGGLLGLASCLFAFPVFLLPIWCAFYGWRGTLRFLGAAAGVIGLLLSAVLLVSPDSQEFFRRAVESLPWREFRFAREQSEAVGFWQWHNSVWRIPVFVTYVVMVLGLSIWPRQKHLGHLIASSAAAVIGIQFWLLQSGGAFVLWYLPLLLLVVFRPALTQHAAPEFSSLRWPAQARAPQPPPTVLAGFTQPRFR